MVSTVAAGERWNSKSKLGILSRELKGWIAIQRALVVWLQAIEYTSGVRKDHADKLAFVSCCSNFGDSFAHALGAIWLSRGSSAVIVFRAVFGKNGEIAWSKNVSHKEKSRT